MVHVHCLPVHFSGAVPPILVTDSAGTFWHWTANRGIDDARVWWLLHRERAGWRDSLLYTHLSANTDLAAAMLLFVEEGIDLLDEWA